VKAKVEEKQGQSHAEVWAEMRPTNEKAARERAEIYRSKSEVGRGNWKKQYHSLLSSEFGC